MNVAMSTNTAPCRRSPAASSSGCPRSPRSRSPVPQRTSPARAQPAAVAAEPGGAAKADAKAPGSGRGPTRRRLRRPQARITIDATPPGAAVAPRPGSPSTRVPERPRRRPATSRRARSSSTSDGRKVKVLGIHGDREFDSFDQFLEQGPWIGALILGSVAIVFLLPLLLVIGWSSGTRCARPGC